MMKRLCLCVAAAVCLCLTSCTLTAPSTTTNRQNAGNAPAASEQTDVGSKPTTPIQTTDGSKPTTPEFDGMTPVLTFEEAYYYYEHHTSFARIKIDEFSDVYRQFYGTEKMQVPVLLVKATVVEDYYGTLSSGTQITLNLILIKHYEVEYHEYPEDNVVKPVYLDAQVIIDFLSQFDYFFFYSLGSQNEIFYPLDQNEFFEQTVHAANYDYYRLLPVSDGKLDLNSLRKFWVENEIEYLYDGACSETKFFGYVQDGLDESVFAEYIRENKERQMNLE